MLHFLREGGGGADRRQGRSAGRCGRILEGFHDAENQRFSERVKCHSGSAGGPVGVTPQGSHDSEN